MAKQVIAVDIDDVLTDTASGLIADYNARYGTTLLHSDFYSKDIAKLGVDHYDVAAERLGRYIRSGVLASAPPLKDALEVIPRLSQQYNFVGVTSRPDSIAETTEAWIKQHFGKHIQKVIFTHFIMGGSSHKGSNVTKPEVCLEIGAKYLVDDHLDHAIPTSKVGVMTFLIDTPWNQSEDLPKGVTRVSNWYDIEEYLNGR